MTIDEIAAAIQAAQKAVGAKFYVSTAAKTTQEGLYVRDVGNGYVKLQYLSDNAEPKRIPLAVRVAIGMALSSLAPAANWKNIDIVEYARSNDTQRRVDTMKSILRSALSQTAEPTKIELPGEKPGEIRTAWISKVINVETWGGDFAEKPKLPDIDKLTALETSQLPKFLSFVRINPDGAERVIILCEAPVGPDGKRADIVSIHYKLSDPERQLVEQGKLLREIPGTARQMIDVHVHVGDVNRPLSGEAQAVHFAKTIEYAEIVIRDLLKQFRGEGFTLTGRLQVSMADGYFHSVHVLLDTKTGTLKPARDAAPVEVSPPKPAAGTELPVDGNPENLDQRLRAIRITLEVDLTPGKEGPTVSVDVGGKIVWVRGGALPEVKELGSVLADLPPQVRTQIASLVKLMRSMAK